MPMRNSTIPVSIALCGNWRPRLDILVELYFRKISMDSWNKWNYWLFFFPFYKDYNGLYELYSKLYIYMKGRIHLIVIAAAIFHLKGRLIIALTGKAATNFSKSFILLTLKENFICHKFLIFVDFVKNYIYILILI